jgi:hypothetical protein
MLIFHLEDSGILPKREKRYRILLHVKIIAENGQQASKKNSRLPQCNVEWRAVRMHSYHAIAPQEWGRR